jgi:outer membrane receptor protein involved in Fe transport
MAEWNGEIPGLETPGNFSVSYFTRRTENMIGLFQTPQFVYYGNYGTAKAIGVELEAGLKSTYADFSFSATWLESEVIDVIGGEWEAAGAYSGRYNEGKKIPNSPEWETNLRGDFRLPWVEGLTLFAEHHYTGEVPISHSEDIGRADPVAFAMGKLALNPGMIEPVFMQQRGGHMKCYSIEGKKIIVAPRDLIRVCRQ